MNKHNCDLDSVKQELGLTWLEISKMIGVGERIMYYYRKSCPPTVKRLLKLICEHPQKHKVISDLMEMD